MSLDPHAQLDQTVLDKIEQSPLGSVPHTPTYQDALRRLYASHQVYASADHKDGHVTVRSLASSPLFHAANLDELVAGKIAPDVLEANDSIFSRYVQSLPAALREKAEAQRVKVVGRAIHHRKHQGVVDPAIHDPITSIVLVPGTGPHPGLPGNYVYGALIEIMSPGAASTWSVQLHDAEDATASIELPTLAEALSALQDLIASAPFQLSELDALGFKSN